MKAHAAWLLSRFAFISSLLFCGAQIAGASVPAVVADGQIALASGFQIPEGVAIAPNGTIYVADTDNNQVVTVSSTGVVTPVSVPGYTLSGPGAVAVDSTGDLFIADSNNARVLELKTSGSVALIAGAPLLNYPASLAFDPAGDLYIGDANNLAIYKVSASTLQTGSGAPTVVTISNVSGLFPGALAADASGDLYIADVISNNIYELPAGQTTAQNVTPAGFTLSAPSGLGFDAAGNWYVLDGGNARIIEVPQATGSAPYMVPVTGLVAPGSLALDPLGNLYVTDLTNNNLTQLIYSGNAINLGQVAVGSTGPAVAVNYELNAPETLTAFRVTMQGDPGQEASTGAGTTCQFQSYTNSPPTSGNPISPLNPFVCLADVQGVPAFPGIRTGAVNLLGSSNELLVSVPFTETGTASTAWIVPGVASTVTLNPSLSTPEGFAISAENDTVYIADAGSGNVYSWKGLNAVNPNLTTVATPGIPLSVPINVALDGGGDLFIADYGLAKIVVVPANTAVPPYVLATGSFLVHPAVLAFAPSGDLYIGDWGPAGEMATSSEPGFIVKVPASGGPISKLNTSPANAVLPLNMVTDAAGNLYVADGGPYVDEETQGPGQIVLVPKHGSSATAITPPGVTSPADLAFDPGGQLWVLDANNLNQLTIVPSNGGGVYTVPLGAPLLAPSQMSFTAGNGALLISDLVGSLYLVSGLQAQLTFPTTTVTTPPTQTPSQAAAILSIGNSALKPATPGGSLYSIAGNTQDFQVQTSSTCLSFAQLLPTQSCAFSASFAPLSSGTKSESITSIFNSPTQVQLVLGGVATGGSPVTATPTVTPGTGSFSTTQTVTISDSTSGAVIYYTTDGSTPTPSSTVYQNPFTVTTTTTVNAIALAPGYTTSQVATATYTLNPYLGDSDYTHAGNDYANAINATYAVTGNDSGGYTVTSCSFYQPSGTVTAGAKMDCGLILAPTPTTKSSSWLCHARYTNPGPSGAGGWITIALSGCGTLPHGTAYWVATDSNDPIQGFPYGFSNCGGSCNGAAPTVGNGTYPYYYSITTYGQYTGLSSSMTATDDGYQASQYVTLGLNTPLQTATPTLSIGSGTYSTAQAVSISDATSGAVIYYTTDGSMPTTSSPVYHSAITVTTTTTINVLAVAAGYTNSAVATATYTFNPYLGTNAYSTAGTDYANFINATYAVTGSNAHGYTVSSCSFFQPTGTVTHNAKIDCGLILAPTPTTKSSSWLCHGTYTNPGSSGAGAWITVSLSGCGTLPAGTAYWVATDSNDTHPAFPYGFWNCGSSCNGSAPTVGTGTYPYAYIQATYGVYTGMSSSITASPGTQASQYVSLTAVP